jgi:ABC-type glycerol-3-phosphate transport system substrate-binding protein
MFLAMALCLAAWCLMASCQRQAGGEQGSGSSAGGKGEVTLTVVNRVNTEVSTENNPMLKYIREKYGFNIQLEAPPINNYNDRLQIIMASGDHPDIVYTWGWDANFLRWAESGMLNPVDDLVKPYPHIMSNVVQANLLPVAQAGPQNLAYGIPRASSLGRRGYMYNTKWLAKLGMNPPTTIDEFYELGKAVATQDPDGNGQNDTFLLSPDANVWDSASLIVWAFLPPSNGAPDFDGVYKIREKMNGYYPFLEFMRKLYAEKIMDQEFFINKTYGGREKAFQGRVALLHTQLGVCEENHGKGLGMDLEFALPLKNTAGKRVNYLGAAQWGGWLLPVSSKKTQDALRFIDWGNSPEGFEILNWGVPGLTYTSYDLKNRTVVQTDEQQKLWNTVTSTYMTVANALEGIQAALDRDPQVALSINQQLTGYLAAVEEIPLPVYRLPEQEEFNQKNPDLITQKDQMETKYVVGEIRLEELKAFINNEWLPKYAPVEAAYLKLMAARK